MSRSHHVLLIKMMNAINRHLFFHCLLVHVMRHSLFHLHLFVIVFHSCMSFHLFFPLHRSLHHHLLVVHIRLDHLFLAHSSICQCHLQLLISPGFYCFNLCFFIKEGLNLHVCSYKALKLDGQLFVGLSETTLVLMKR